LRVAATFLLVLLSWVLFRAESLERAIAFFSNMVGMGPRFDGSGLLGGIVYQPFYLLIVLSAAAVTWLAPQTWDWTRRLGAVKVSICLVLLWAALAMMTAQEYNPFIYFIF
jgi:alginate O-acetyltransferase complex protein AlgI